jgi:uncharacterized protein (TIGR03067 family)
MIQFGRALIDRSSCAKRGQLRLFERSDFSTFRGIITMTATKRLGMNAWLTISAFAFAVATLAALGLAASTARAADDAKAATKLDGDWETDGEGIESKWSFEGKTVKATVNGQDYKCKVENDENAKPNPTLDLTIDEGPEESKGKVSKCIYKFTDEGKKLTLCVSLPGKDRPKDFAQVEDEAYLFVLKKAKKE